jgi:Cu/Ag efflux pump CusA
VVAVAALLMVFGFTQLSQMPVDVLPEFSRPYVELQTESLGLSAQEMEAFITTPLEADMLNGTPWAVEMRSVTIPGLSSIVMLFDRDTDVMKARQVVQERMIEVFALPNVSQPTTMINPVSASGRIMEIGMTSDQVSLIDMSILARWTVVPRLQGTPGVANVSIWGERQRQLQVLVDPERLRSENLTLHQVISTTGNALWASPLSFLEASTPGTGGWIETPNQRLMVQHRLPIQTAEDLAKITIEGAPSKRLGDVAQVIEDHQPLIGDAFIDESPSLMLVVEKFPWANTQEVTREVEAALAALQPGLKGIKMDPTLYRPATYIDLAQGNISTALTIGIILVIVALFVFFMNWRTALIGTVAVVSSLLAAGTVLYFQGVTINMMLIGGLVIALGIIIDNAIVDMNNMVRRLRKARETGSSESAMTLVFESTFETRRTLLYATVIMVLAVFPAVVLHGVTGEFYKPLVNTYLISLIVSFLVAMTITPALSYYLLRNAPLKSGDSPLLTALRGVYNALFGWAASIPRTAFIVVVILTVIGFASMLFLRQESLLPDFKETDLVISVKGEKGASHAAMSKMVTNASQELRKIPGVHNVTAHIGRAILSDRRTNIDEGEVWVSVDPAANYDETAAAVKKAAANIPGLSPEVRTNMISQVRKELAGSGDQLVVRVYGEDLGIIRNKADEIQKAIERIDGVSNPTVQYPEEMPTVEIQVDVEKAKGHNLKPGDVRRAATTFVSGIEAGSLFEEQKVFDVMVWGTPETRNSVESVKNLLIDKPNGGHVRLAEVADVNIVLSAVAIYRDGGIRRMDVTAGINGRDIAAIGADIKAAIQGVDFPLEYRAELLGEYAEQQAARQQVFAFVIAAVIGIFLLFQAFFKSWRLAIATSLTLPMALAGGAIAALLIEGTGISIGSVIGFFAILGIAVQNIVSLAGRYQQLGRNPGEDAIKRVTYEQSGSILMTAVTAALAFLPMAFFGSVAGLEIFQPMAIVVIGGLITTTLYSLMGVPAIYAMFGKYVAEEVMVEADVVA